MPPAKHNKPRYEKKFLSSEKAFVNSAKSLSQEEIYGTPWQEDYTIERKRQIFLDNGIDNLDGLGGKKIPIGKCTARKINETFTNYHEQYVGNIKWHEDGGWERELREAEEVRIAGNLEDEVIKSPEIVKRKIKPSLFPGLEEQAIQESERRRYATGEK